MNVRRGEIYFITKFNDPSVGTEIRQGRPFLVVSPNNMTKNARGALCVPLTLQEKPPIAQHCNIDTFGKDSTVLCEQIRYIDESYFGSYYATATASEMAAVDRCLMAAVGVSPEVLSGDAAAIRAEANRLAEIQRAQISELNDKLGEAQAEIERLKIKEEAYISIIRK